MLCQTNLRAAFMTFLLVWCQALGAVELSQSTYEYKIGKDVYSGYLVSAKSAAEAPRKGGILLVHDWMGLTPKTQEQADKVAKLGYTVLAVDIFGKCLRPNDAQEAGQNAAIYYKDRQLFRNRIQAGFTELKNILKTPTLPIAALGYCFGGTAVLELARSGADLAGVVSFHGSLDSTNQEDGKNIKTKVLALHGADDPYVKAENLAAFEQEMRHGKVDWQLIKYGNAVHSFTDKSAGTDLSKGAAYDAHADRRSWQLMQEFLNEVFQTP